jgi:chromosome segregation ATPase
LNVIKTKLKVALSKSCSLIKRDALNLSDGDIEKIENNMEEGGLVKTLPAKRSVPEQKEEISEREMYLSEIQIAYEQSKKYCEEAKDLAESLVSAHNEINNCNRVLLKKFASKETMDEFTVLVKGMTQEIEKLKQENTQPKNNASEALSAKINELEGQIKGLHEDRSRLINEAKSKIEEEKQRFIDLAKKLEEVQQQLLDSRLSFTLTHSGKDLVIEGLHKEVKELKEHITSIQPARDNETRSRFEERIGKSENLEDLLGQKEGSESDIKTSKENATLQTKFREEGNIKKYQSQIKTLQESVKSLQQDYKSLLELFTERTEELAKFEEDKAVLEKALADTKSLVDKTNETDTQTQELLNQIVELESEKLGLRKRVAELEEKLLTNSKAMEYFYEKLPLVESSIGNFQSQIETLKTENETLKQGELSSVILNLQEELGNLRKENEDNKVLVESLRSELNGKEIKVKTLRHKPNEGEEHKESNLKLMIDMDCNEDRCMIRNRKSQSRELRVAKNREEILRKQIGQLKFLVENYEDSNKQLIEYINASTNPFSPSDSKVKELRSKLRVKESELNLAVLDNGRLRSDINVLNVEAGEKNAECERNKTELAKLTCEVLLLQGKLNQDEAGINSQILGREDEILKLQKKLKLALEELKSTKDMLADKVKECQELQNRVKVNDELMQSYKVVCDSNQKYKEEIEVLRKESVKCQEVQKQAVDQNVRIEELERDNSNLLNELSTQANQVKDVMQRLKEGYELLKVATEEKSKREHDFTQMQNVSQCITSSYLCYTRKN